jgi:hypothetical protein
MGERSATHRFFPARNTSMGNASLTHPTICPLSEIPMHAINDRDEAQSGRDGAAEKTICETDHRWVTRFALTHPTP